MGDSFHAFLERMGWPPGEGSAAERVHEGHLVVRMEGREPLTIIEVGIGKPWPTYDERRECRFDVTAPGNPPNPRDRAAFPIGHTPDGNIIVFTDPARSRYLWTWTQAERWIGRRYIEFLFPDAAAPLAEGLLQRWRGDPASGEKSTAPMEVPTLMRAILDRAGIVVPGSGQNLVEVCRWCQMVGDPDGIRFLWRELGQTRVIDPACGDGGDWLLEMASVLGALHIACIDRMRSLLQDHTPRNGPGRSLRVDEFRTILSSVDDRRRHASAEAMVRERIASQCLFGWCEGSREMRVCRGRVSAWSGAGEEAGMNIRRQPPGSIRRNGLTTNRDRPSDSAAGLSEEEDILRFARNFAARDPDSFHSTSDRRRFRREFERRRMRLVRRISASAELGGPCEGDPTGPVDLLGIGLWSRDDIRAVRAVG